MIFNQTLPTQGGGGTHSVTCAEGQYVSSEVPDSWRTPEVTEMDFTTGATVYIWRSSSASPLPPVAKASNGTILEPTGYRAGDFNVWWSYSMPDHCVTVGNTAYAITTHHVSVDSGNNIILATADNSDPLQYEGECVVGSPVFVVAADGQYISTEPDTGVMESFQSDIGTFWSFVMPDTDVVIYE